MPYKTKNKKEAWGRSRQLGTPGGASGTEEHVKKGNQESKKGTGDSSGR